MPSLSPKNPKTFLEQGTPNTARKAMAGMTYARSRVLASVMVLPGDICVKDPVSVLVEQKITVSSLVAASRLTQLF